MSKNKKQGFFQKVFAENKPKSPVATKKGNKKLKEYAAAASARGKKQIPAKETNVYEDDDELSVDKQKKIADSKKRNQGIQISSKIEEYLKKIPGGKTLLKFLRWGPGGSIVMVTAIFLDILSQPFANMPGREVNWKKLRNGSCLFLLLGTCLPFGMFYAYHNPATAEFMIGKIPKIGLAMTVIFFLGGASMLAGSYRLKTENKFQQFFSKKVDQSPAFDNGFRLELGEVHLALEDCHTNLGALGGIGTGKNVCNSLKINYLDKKGSVRSKPAGHVKIGDKLQTPSGSATVSKMIKEKLQLYVVILESGRSAGCSIDHLWKINRPDIGEEAITETGSIIELMATETIQIPVSVNGVLHWEKITKIIQRRKKVKMTCFVLDDTEHLFICTNGIVTHNCLHPDQGVMMWDGTIKKAKDVQQGDWLMGPDGDPRIVKRTNTGYGPLYRIIPAGNKGTLHAPGSSKGKPWICNDVHVMTLKYSNKNGSRPARRSENGIVSYDHHDRKKTRKGLSFVYGDVVHNNRKAAKVLGNMLEKNNYIEDVDLNLILERSGQRDPSQFWKLFRPAIEIQFPEFPNLQGEFLNEESYKKKLEKLIQFNKEEFYLTGCWLGDGTQNEYRISNLKGAVIDSFRNYIETYPALFFQERAVAGKNENFRTCLIRSASRGCATTPFHEMVNEFLRTTVPLRKTLSQICRQDPNADKNIPHWAMTADPARRKQLLAGLLDTDGFYDERCHCFDFVQKRKHLVEQTCFIARSLGIGCSEPAESWKECTNRTKLPPEVVELLEDDNLLHHFVRRGLPKLQLHLNEGKIEQDDYDMLRKAFEGLLNPLTDNEKPDLWSVQQLSSLHKSEPRELYWRICIFGDIGKIPTRIDYKQVSRERALRRTDGRDLPGITERDTQDPLCHGWTAEPIGDGEYAGFTLSGDGRFLLDDFTVTHNTQAFMNPLLDQFFKQLSLPEPSDSQKNDPAFAWWHKHPLQKCGALILDQKGDFIDFVIYTMLRYGRPLEDLVVIDPMLDLYCFNPLDPIASADDNANTLAQIQKIVSGGGGGGKDKFWDEASKDTIRDFLQMLEVIKPKEKIGLDDLARYIREDDLAAYLCDRVIEVVESKHKAGKLTYEEYSKYKDTASRALAQWVNNKSDNVKSTLKVTINQLLGDFAADPRLQKVFCRNTNFNFIDVFNRGKVVLFRGTGVSEKTAKVICVALKLAFQTQAKRRNGANSEKFGINPRRTCLFFVDEYQEFVTPDDGRFFGVSRSSKVAGVIATQAYSSLQFAMDNEVATNLLRQNIGTWIFLRTTDQKTIELGEMLAGQIEKEKLGRNIQADGILDTAMNLGGSGHQGKGGDISVSKQFESFFRKDAFLTLNTVDGNKSKIGPYYSEAIIYHYHSTDVSRPSRMYKTRLRHIYDIDHEYNTAFKSGRVSQNTMDLDQLMYDRNAVIRMLRRVLPNIQDVWKNTNVEREILETQMSAKVQKDTIINKETEQENRRYNLRTHILDQIMTGSNEENSLYDLENDMENHPDDGFSRILEELSKESLREESDLLTELLQEAMQTNTDKVHIQNIKNTLLELNTEIEYRETEEAQNAMEALSLAIVRFENNNI